MTDLLYLYDFFSLFIPLLFAVAVLTLIERKVLASMQRRRGPNVVGFFGLLQPFADGIKLLTKETIIPTNVRKVSFVAAPLLMFTLSLLSWYVIPFEKGLSVINLDVGLLYILALSSLNVYAIILAGWASKSKYAVLGAIRAAAQTISYEICLSLALVAPVTVAHSFNLNDIVEAQQIWFVIPLFPAFLLSFIIILAELNRVPFDLTEAESELVAGYMVEYSAFTFALFFLAEYSNILLYSAILSLCFFGGWYLPFFGSHPLIFGFKIICISYLIIWIRATLPRVRFDQLMTICWQYLLPLSLCYLVFVAGLVNLLW